MKSKGHRHRPAASRCLKAVTRSGSSIRVAAVATRLNDVPQLEQAKNPAPPGLYSSDHTACLTALGTAIALLALAIANFGSFPRLDLAIDGLFSSPGTSVSNKDLETLQGLRAPMIMA